MYTKKGRHRVGEKAILELNFPWLHVSDSGLFCKLCQRYGPNKAGTWVTEGYKLLRKDKVRQHLETAQHKEAILRETESNSTQGMINRISTKEMKCVGAMMEVMHFIAAKNHALDEFGDLVDLNIKLGAENLLPIRQSPNAMYTSNEAVHEILEALSLSLDAFIHPRLQKSPCYSLILDEVADNATLKNLGIVIKYIKGKGEPEMKFLADVEMPRATGLQIKEAVFNVLEEKWLDPRKCTCSTSDGAASFLGKTSGADALIRNSIGSNLIVMHCHDHRLALACSAAFKSIKKLDGFCEGMSKLFKFYEYSTVSASTLRELQGIHKQAHWRVQQAKHHRWLSYDKAVTTILKGFDVLVEDLENATISSEMQSSHKIDANACLKWLTSEQTIRVLALLGDVMPILSDVNLFFQRRNVDLGFVESSINKALQKISQRLTIKGHWEKQVGEKKIAIKLSNCNEKLFFNDIKQPFISALMSEVKLRFSNAEIISNLSALALPIDDHLRIAFHAPSGRNCQSSTVFRL